MVSDSNQLLCMPLHVNTCTVLAVLGGVILFVQIGRNLLQVTSPNQYSTFHICLAHCVHPYLEHHTHHDVKVLVQDSCHSMDQLTKSALVNTVEY
jgi:hypothetical protein